VSGAIVSPGDLGVTTSLRRRRRFGSPLIILSFVVAGSVFVLAVLGHLIAPQDPSAQNFVIGLSKPSGAHWFGTDPLGRDVFSRVLVGARTAIVGPLVITIASTVIGNLLGVLAGYKGGTIDASIMRWVDLMWSLPGLLVIIVVAGALGGGYWLAVGLMILFFSPGDARIIRGATLEQTPRPYVEAARTLGVSDTRIMLRHIIPNVSPITVAQAFLIFAGTIVGMAGLSFLGLGVRPGTADWGLMVAEGRDQLFANPASVLAPAAMLVLTATSVNLIGDWMFERLSGRGATR
jgi:peptide/nickel transport system permease protein